MVPMLYRSLPMVDFNLPVRTSMSKDTPYLIMAKLFIMSPKPQNFNDFLGLENLIHQSVLNIYSAGIGTGKITCRFYGGGRVLEGIGFQNFKQFFSLTFQACPNNVLRILLSLRCKNNLPAHQSSSLWHCATS